MLFSVRACKEDASDFLKSNRLCGPMFLLLFLLFFSLIGVLFLLEVFAKHLTLRFPTVNQLPLFVGCGGGVLICILVLLPLWRGMKVTLMHALCYGAIKAENVLFFFRDRKRYGYALRYSLRTFLRLALYVALAWVLSDLGSRVGGDLIEADREAAAILILILSLFFVILLTACFFFWRVDSFLMDAAFLTAPHLSYRQLRAFSSIRMKRGRRALLKMNASFFPVLLISVLMAGLPLFFVLPYYVASRSCLAYRLLCC